MDSDPELDLDESSIAQSLKIVLLGNSAVGKSSLMMRYKLDEFSLNIEPTVGSSFFSNTLIIGTKSITLSIWDTSGQERFDSLAPLYYRDAHAAILVFDVTDIGSFPRLKFWYGELMKNNSSAAIAIAANKMDLFERKEHGSLLERGREFAIEHDTRFFETSSKTGQNVVALFEGIARHVLLKGSYSPKPIGVDIVKKGRKNRRSCCK